MNSFDSAQTEKKWKERFCGEKFDRIFIPINRMRKARARTKRWRRKEMWSARTIVPVSNYGYDNLSRHVQQAWQQWREQYQRPVVLFSSMRLSLSLTENKQIFRFHATIAMHIVRRQSSVFTMCTWALLVTETWSTTLYGTCVCISDSKIIDIIDRKTGFDLHTRTRSNWFLLLRSRSAPSAQRSMGIFLKTSFSVLGEPILPLLRSMPRRLENKQ